MDYNTYNSKVREINHFKNAWNEEFTIVNQSYWFKGNLSDEEAIKKWNDAKEDNAADFTESERRTIIQMCRSVFGEKNRHIKRMNSLLQRDDATEEDIAWAKDFIERDYKKMKEMNEIIRKLEAK